jgi:hypothetical protein
MVEDIIYCSKKDERKKINVDGMISDIDLSRLLSIFATREIKKKCNTLDLSDVYIAPPEIFNYLTGNSNILDVKSDLFKSRCSHIQTKWKVDLTSKKHIMFVVNNKKCHWILMHCHISSTSSISISIYDSYTKMNRDITEYVTAATVILNFVKIAKSITKLPSKPILHKVKLHQQQSGSLTCGLHVLSYVVQLLTIDDNERTELSNNHSYELRFPSIDSDFIDNTKTSINQMNSTPPILSYYEDLLDKDEDEDEYDDEDEDDNDFVHKNKKFKHTI